MLFNPSDLSRLKELSNLELHFLVRELITETTEVQRHCDEKTMAETILLVQTAAMEVAIRNHFQPAETTERYYPDGITFLTDECREQIISTVGPYPIDNKFLHEFSFWAELTELAGM